ncbi:GntR family transcriptional regulator [Nonomuraea bangladeshensis]
MSASTHRLGSARERRERLVLVSPPSRTERHTAIQRTDVLQDHYKPGQALPGEAFLANEYATSRPTIRKAIAQLVGEGLLTVAHGRGTFVRPTPDRRLILLGAAEREDLLSPAYDPSRQGWEHVTVPSDAERADSRLGPNMPIFMIIERSTADTLNVRRGRMSLYRYAHWQHTKTHARAHLSSYVLADQVDTITFDEGQPRLEDEVAPGSTTPTWSAYMARCAGSPASTRRCRTATRGKTSTWNPSAPRF